jgi:hypothetical protein
MGTPGFGGRATTPGRGPLYAGSPYGVSAAQAVHAAQVAQYRQAQAMMNSAFNSWAMGMMYSGGMHPMGGMGPMATGGMHGGSVIGGMGHMSRGHH